MRSFSVLVLLLLSVISLVSALPQFTNPRLRKSQTPEMHAVQPFIRFRKSYWKSMGPMGRLPYDY